jgi:hypothetical protein
MPMLGIMASSITGGLVTSSFESIATSSPTSGTAITFSSIAGTYKSLQLRFNILTTAGNSITMRFNGDTGTNYIWHAIYGDGTTAYAGTGGTGGTNILLMGTNTGTVATYSNVGIVDIIDYASTTKFKTSKAFTGNDKNAASAEIDLLSGLWRSTAAITSLTITTGTFASGSTIALYGIK